MEEKNLTGMQMRYPTEYERSIIWKYLIPKFRNMQIKVAAISTVMITIGSAFWISGGITPYKEDDLPGFAALWFIIGTLVIWCMSMGFKMHAKTKAIKTGNVFVANVTIMGMDKDRLRVGVRECENTNIRLIRGDVERYKLGMNNLFVRFGTASESNLDDCVLTWGEAIKEAAIANEANGWRHPSREESLYLYKNVKQIGSARVMYMICTFAYWCIALALLCSVYLFPLGVAMIIGYFIRRKKRMKRFNDLKKGNVWVKESVVVNREISGLDSTDVYYISDSPDWLDNVGKHAVSVGSRVYVIKFDYDTSCYGIVWMENKDSIEDKLKASANIIKGA